MGRIEGAGNRTVYENPQFAQLHRKPIKRSKTTSDPVRRAIASTVDSVWAKSNEAKIEKNPLPWEVGLPKNAGWRRKKQAIRKVVEKVRNSESKVEPRSTAEEKVAQPETPATLFSTVIGMVVGLSGWFFGSNQPKIQS